MLRIELSGVRLGRPLCSSRTVGVEVMVQRMLCNEIAFSTLYYALVQRTMGSPIRVHGDRFSDFFIIQHGSMLNYFLSV